LDEKELILDNTPDEKEDIEGHFCVETKQTLRAFTPVTLLLTPIENSTKFTVSLYNFTQSSQIRFIFQKLLFNVRKIRFL
jgi:hypothetical protein